MEVPSTDKNGSTPADVVAQIGVVSKQTAQNMAGPQLSADKTPDVVSTVLAEKGTPVVEPTDETPAAVPTVLSSDKSLEGDLSSALGDALSGYFKETGKLPAEAIAAQARQNLYGSLGTNPDQSNTAMKAADELGVPESLVQGEQALAEAEIALMGKGYDPQRFAQLHPETINWYAKNPNNAKIAFDDLAGMNGLARVGATFKNSADKYAFAIERGDLGSKLADGSITPTERARLNEILNQSADGGNIDSNTWEFKAGSFIFDNTIPLVGDLGRAAGETVQKIGWTTAASFIPLVRELGPAEIVGATFAWAMHDVQSKREWGNRWLDLRMMQDKNGNKLTDEQARAGAWLMSEAAGLSALVDSHVIVKALAIKPMEMLGAKLVAGEIGRELFEKEIVQTALQKYTVDIGVMGAAAASQSLFNTITVEGVKAWNNLGDNGQFQGTTVGDAVSEAVKTGIGGAVGAALPIAVLSFAGSRFQYKDSFELAQNIRKAVELKAAAEQSVLVSQRGSGQVRTLFQDSNSTKASGQKQFFVDADGFRSLFGDKAQEAADKLGVGEMFKNSAPDGGTKLPIKVQDYLANYKELFSDKEIQNFFTTKENQLSQSEGATLQKINAEKQAAADEAVKASDRIKARRQIEQDLKDKMVKAGRSKANAGIVSKIVAHVYDAVAASKGKKGAFDLYREKHIGFGKKDLILNEYGKPQRGDYQFGDEKSLIHFSKISDGTTSFHEVSHHTLDLLNEIDLSHDQDLSASFDAALEYIGAKKGQKISDAAHEKWASIMEEWFQNGMAPEPGKKSDRLQALFAASKRIFDGVYGERDAMTSSPMTAIFAKMLGMEDAIKAAEQKVGLDEVEVKAGEKAPKKSNENVGMNKRSYSKKLAALIKRVTDKVTISKQKDFASIERAARGMAIDEIKGSDFFRAARLLKTGKLEVTAADGTVINVANDIGVKGKLSLMDLEALYNDGAITQETFGRLKKFATASGMHLQEFAALFGREGDSVTFLNEVNSMNQNVDKVISQRAAQKMMDSGMDKLFDDDEIQKLALDTVLTDSKYKAIANQVRALNKLAGIEGGIDVDAVRAKAKIKVSKEIGARVAGDSYAEKLQNEATKAGNKAKKALANDDYAAAAEHNKRQLEILLEREALIEARKGAKKALDFLSNLEDMVPKIFMGNEKLAEAAERLLAVIATEKRSKADVLGGRQTLKDWISELQRETVRIDIPAEVNDANARFGIDEMTLGTLMSVSDFARNIVMLAKAELDVKKAIRNGEAVNTIAESVRVLRENFPQRFKDYEAEKFELRDSQFRTHADKHDWWTNTIGGLNDAKNTVKIFEFVFRKMDGDKPDGFFTKRYFRPIAEAYDRKTDQVNAALVDFGGALKKYTDAGGDITSVSYNKFLKKKLSNESLIAIALNSGSESNLDAFIAGNRLGLTHDNIRSFLDQSLSKRDIDLCNQIWALENKDAERVEHFMRIAKSGEKIEMVEAQPIQLKNGKLNGGYHTLNYRDHANYAYDQTAVAGAAMADLGPIDRIARIRTKAGFANERVPNKEKEVNLSLDVVNRHINELYTAMNLMEPVADLNKLLLDKTVRDHINIAIGDGTAQAMNSWLAQSVGDLRRGGKDPLGNALSTIRTNVVRSMLLFKPMTAFLQGLGYFTIMDEVGLPRTIQAMAEVSGNPFKARARKEYVNRKSTMMRNRVGDQFREEKDFSSGGRTKLEMTKKGFDAAGMAMLHAVQSEVDYAAWTAGYRKALELNPRDEAGAIAYADSVVRTTQTTSAKYGQSALLASEDPYQKLWTTFGSYGNLVLNRVGARMSKVQREGLPGVPEFVGGLMTLVVIPAIAEQYIRGQGLQSNDPEELRKFFSGIGKNSVAQMVPLGSLWFDPGRGAAVGRMFEQIINTGTKLYTGSGDGFDVARMSFAAGGLAFGFPASEANIINTYFERLTDGEDPSPLELISPRPRQR